MPDPSADSQNAWIERVLGVRVAAAAAPPPEGKSPPFPKLWAEAVEAWRDASETVDAQISNLQAALKKTDDDQLHDIAEFGLNGITGGTKVRLMAAIASVNTAAAAAPPALLGKARQAVASFAAQIENDPRVDACDANPFGTRVSIRSIFHPALARLDTVLKSAETTGTRG